MKVTIMLTNGKLMEYTKEKCSTVEQVTFNGKTAWRGFTSAGKDIFTVEEVAIKRISILPNE